jgi:hypothetical protein
METKKVARKINNTREVNVKRIQRAFAEANRAAQEEAARAAIALGFKAKGLARAVDRELTIKVPNPGIRLEQKLVRMTEAEASRIRCLLTADYLPSGRCRQRIDQVAFIHTITDSLQRDLPIALSA